VLVYVGAGLLSWSVREFAFVNVLLAFIWLFLAWRIRRESEKLESPPREAESAAVA
jgi:hypothetical protein